MAVNCYERVTLLIIQKHCRAHKVRPPGGLANYLNSYRTHLLSYYRPNIFQLNKKKDLVP